MNPATSLETSLVEWKPNYLGQTKYLKNSLETSLVEWKRRSIPSGATVYSFLGNFLSGMETDGVNVTFWYRRDLGNFLSGMETRGNAVHTALFIINLGNFLSGMET